jgi:Flp pilus assembly protein TadG
MIKRAFKDERGQSAIIMVVIVLVILVIFALVVDVGNAYAERRRAQNAADAAALAGTQVLASGSGTNRQVRAAMIDFAGRNGIPANGVTGEYTDLDGVVLMQIPDTSSKPPANAQGVKATVYKEFATYFARVIQWGTLPAAADANAFVCNGCCDASNLYPIALSQDTFKDDPDQRPVKGKVYTIWNDKLEAPGNFGWVNWGDKGNVDNAYWNGQPPKQDTAETNLANNMHVTTRSGGPWAVGDWVPGTTGNMFQSNKVTQELDWRLDGTLPNQVVIPIYDQLQGTGSNTSYRISGFAQFSMVDYGKVRNDASGGWEWYIHGRFDQFVEASINAGCADFLCSTAAFKPPNATKSIIGEIQVRVPQLKDYSGSTTEYPMDICLVMDHTGSMGSSWSGGGGEPKLTTAKRVLANKNATDPTKNGFLYRLKDPNDPNSMLIDTRSQAAGGHEDKVCFVGYPVTQSGKSFKAACSGRWINTYYFGSLDNGLTDSKDAVATSINNMSADGWTPIAGGLQQATAAIQQNWRDNSLKFIILASDGMANVPLTGQPTEVDDARYGPTWPYPACNQVSATDAIAEAMRATNRHDLANPAERGAEAVVFTVAIGDPSVMNPTLLRSMASQKPGTSDRYFYQVRNPGEMDAAYQDIQRKIEEIKQGCAVYYGTALASGATARLVQNGASVRSVVADEGGDFVFSDVAPGTYTIQVEYTRDGLPYDTYVDQLGGAQLTPEGWSARYTVTVPDDDVQETLGPYTFYMQTSMAPSCPH